MFKIHGYQYSWIFNNKFMGFNSLYEQICTEKVEEALIKQLKRSENFLNITDKSIKEFQSEAHLYTRK